MGNQEYKNLKEFWNTSLKIEEVQKIEGKWCDQESFNNLVNDFVNEESVILDFGCGGGWALPEIFFTKNFKEGIGLDPSKNGIDYCSKVAEISGLDKISYICGDETKLESFEDYFDLVFSFNVIDVLPDQIGKEIVSKIYKSIKKDGYLIMGINPDYPEDLLKSFGYEFKNSCIYKNGILRGNIKSIDEWKDFFLPYFETKEIRLVSLVEREVQYPRRVFVLKEK